MKPLTFFILLITMANNSSAQKYLFYLHGAVVEGQGDGASNTYGTYKYNDIVNAFRKENFTVISEIRKSGTDVKAYAEKMKHEIDSLLNKGVPAKNITVVGGSKGALIAMYVSTFEKNKEMNFVFLAACNDGNYTGNPEIKFYGNILSIYEKSDDIGESCVKFKNKSSATINHYKEIEVNTGKNHGFLFQPYPEWFNPAVKWAKGNYE